MASLSEMLDYAKERDARRGANVRGLAKLIDAASTGYEEGTNLELKRQQLQNDALLKIAQLQEAKQNAAKSESEAQFNKEMADRLRQQTLNDLDSKKQQPKDLTAAGKMNSLGDFGGMKLDSFKVGNATFRSPDAPDESIVTNAQISALASGDPAAISQAFPGGANPKQMEFINSAFARKQQEAQAHANAADRSEKDALKATAAAAKAEAAAAKGLTAENAGKLSMLDQASSDIGDVQKLITNPDGTINRKLVFETNALPGGVPFTKGRDVNSSIENAINAKLRAETGVAANPNEVKNVSRRFKPSNNDSDETIKGKLQRLNEYVAETANLIDPSGEKRKAASVRSTGGAPSGPTVGEIDNGYKYIGGNPADPKSWEKQ